MSPPTIALSQIDTSDRLRPVDALVVEAYAAIAEQRVTEGMSPLIQPIVIRPIGEQTEDGFAKYKLIAGANRLAALQAIGREQLLVGDDVVVRVEGEEAARDSEIFENLANAGLSALDRAIFLNEAKQRFDAKRGETRGASEKTLNLKRKKKSQSLRLFLPSGSRRPSPSASACPSGWFKNLSTSPRPSIRRSSPSCAGR